MLYNSDGGLVKLFCAVVVSFVSIANGISIIPGCILAVYFAVISLISSPDTHSLLSVIPTASSSLNHHSCSIGLSSFSNSANSACARELSGSCTDSRNAVRFDGGSRSQRCSGEIESITRQSLSAIETQVFTLLRTNVQAF